jgi:hypothetical protein
MPSMVNLTHSVNVVAKDIISVVAAFPRIRNQNFDDEIKSIVMGSKSSSSDKGGSRLVTEKGIYIYIFIHVIYTMAIVTMRINDIYIYIYINIY